MRDKPAKQTPKQQALKRDTWPIRAIAILLLIQAAGFLYISFDLLARHDWGFIQAAIEARDESLIDAFDIPQTQIEAVETTITLTPLALLAILSALGFLFLLRLGWTLAMITQGLSLWACLSFYFGQKPFFIYPLMVYSILMVLYLNSFHVRLAFHASSTSASTGAGHDSSG